MECGPLYVSGGGKGQSYCSKTRFFIKGFLSAPFAQSLGQVVGAALPYPGEAGRLRAGPSPVCGLTAPFFPAPGESAEECGPSQEPGRSPGT